MEQDVALKELDWPSDIDHDKMEPELLASTLVETEMASEEESEVSDEQAHMKNQSGCEENGIQGLCEGPQDKEAKPSNGECSRVVPVAIYASYQQQQSSSKCEFTCRKCGQQFMERRDMIVHSLTHNGERPFACGECGKAFLQRVHLKQHFRIHTGEKPYSCSVCGAAFCQQVQLSRHERAVHSGDRPYACQQRVTLAIHERKHTGERFVDANALNIPRKTYTRERPYKCDYCSKTFVNSSHLSRHKKSHKNDIHEELLYCEQSVLPDGTEEQYSELHD